MARGRVGSEALVADVDRRAGRVPVGPAFRLTRVENCVFAFVATAIGFSSARHPHAPAWRGVVAGTVAGLVLAFGNVVNDLFDQRADQRSKPWRPLPSGRITRWGAGYVATFLVLSAVVGGGMLGLALLGFVGLMLLLAFAYSARLKGVPLLGNLAVAVQVGSTIVFGALVAGSPRGVTFAAAGLLLLYSLNLEVAKTLEDRDADGSVGVTTVAHVVPPSWQSPLLLTFTALAAITAVACGAALTPPVGYWLVLAPLVPLLVFARQWSGGAGRVAAVGRCLRASKALWCFGLVGLALLP